MKQSFTDGLGTFVTDAVVGQIDVRDGVVGFELGARKRTVGQTKEQY